MIAPVASANIVRRLREARRCLASVLPRLAGVEIEILDGQIPVRVEDFKAPLLFLLVGVLVGEELFQDRRGIKVIVGDLRVLEDDSGAKIPAAVFGGVV